MTIDQLYRFKETWKRLVIAARELNAARYDLRRIASHIAGCDVSEWSFMDCGDYLDLFIKSRLDKESP